MVGDITSAQLALNGGELWTASEVEIDRWALAYPGVSVPAELLKMAAWTHDNKTNRPTGKGVRRFVGTWLAKQQDKSGKPVQGFAVPIFGRGKPEPNQPTKSISGDLYRHAIALDQMVHEKLTGIPAERVGTYKFNLDRTATAIVEGERKRYEEGEYSSGLAMRSACYGTARVTLLKVWNE